MGQVEHWSVFFIHQTGEVAGPVDVEQSADNADHRACAAERNCDVVKHGDWDQTAPSDHRGSKAGYSKADADGGEARKSVGFASACVFMSDGRDGNGVAQHHDAASEPRE